MEKSEHEAIVTAPLPAKPKLWKRYVDDTIEIVKKQQVGILGEQLI